MSWVNAVVQGILLGGLYALFACGLSLLFGVMNVINLAHGDLAVVAAYLAVVIIPSAGIDAPLSFLVAIPLFAVLGYVGQRTLIQASLERGPFTTLLATFGISVVIENGLLELFSADSHSLNIGSFTSGSIHVGQLSVGVLSVTVFAVAVVVIFGRSIASALILGAVMVLLYLPMSYYTDRFLYKRRLRQKHTRDSR